MKAVYLEQFGGPDVLTAGELADPVVGPRDVLVSLAGAGVNFIDTYQRQGKYPGAFPLIPGFEGAGEIIAVGEAVSRFQIGDQVAWPMSPGSYAQKVCVPEDKLVRLPDFIPADLAAGLMLQGVTAQYLTEAVFEVGPETTALVHAAAGGTGQALIQAIRARGGRVIGTVSNETKAAIARDCGAHEVIIYSEVDFVDAVKTLTDGRGVNVIYDGIGHDTMERGLHALSRRGMMVYFGAASGSTEALDLQLLSSLGSLTLSKPTLKDFITTREELEYRTGVLFEWIKQGVYSPPETTHYPFERAAAAHQDLESRASTGKLVLVP